VIKREQNLCSRCGRTEGNAVGLYDETFICIACGSELPNKHFIGHNPVVFSYADAQVSTNPTVEIPDGYTEIEGCALEDSVVADEMGGAFGRSHTLEKLILPDTIRKIGNYAFTRCLLLKDVEMSPVISLNEIGKSAFSTCISLEKFYVPPSVTDIGDNAFAACSGLTEIDVAEGNARYFSKDGVLYDRQNKELKRVPGGKKGDIDKIPCDIIKIEASAFSGCQMKHVAIPDSIKDVGSFAFRGCDKLVTIFLSESIAVIKSYTFKDCTSLKSIKIPKSVAFIEKYAFEKCTNLLYVIIDRDSEVEIQADAFKGCRKLKSVTLPKNAKIYAGAFDEDVALRFFELKLIDKAKKEMFDRVNELKEKARELRIKREKKRYKE